jgi:hypothetical protein
LLLERAPCRRRVGELGGELGLALRQSVDCAGRSRHCGRVLLFGVAQRRFDLRQPSLDVGARRSFLTDQPIEFGRPFGGSGLRGEPVATGARVGGG